MYIKVRVITKAKEDKLEKMPKGELKIWVKVPAERNLANEAVLRLVKSEFPEYNGDIRIVSGHHSPSKILSLGR
jgi:uncharacterized protein YggU (UPF0235/DUF167 family)